MKDMFFTILEHVKAARKQPEQASGLIKTVMETDVDGDKMDDFRIASLCSVILIGGTDTLPKALSVGRYHLKIRARDERSRAEAETSIPFEMVADEKLAASVPK